MKFQKLYEAGVEMAFIANESYDRIAELKTTQDIKLIAFLQRHDKRVETCNRLGLAFGPEDYNDVAEADFYVTAATLEAEKARFESLCEAVGKTLTGVGSFESAPSSYTTDTVLV